MAPRFHRRTGFVRGRRRRLKADLKWLLIVLVLLGAAIAQALEADLLSLFARVSAADMAAPVVASLIAASLVLSLPMRAWHRLANALAEKRAVPLKGPWVVDGDTIDDRATGVRYRLANIDAPETGDNAKCYNERQRGEQARSLAIVVVRAATVVAVRRTFRHDQYGRRVAFVLVDGVDLGEVLMQRGFALPWVGRREPWCGPGGGLAKIAASGGWSMSCRTCGIVQGRSTSNS